MRFFSYLHKKRNHLDKKKTPTGPLPHGNRVNPIKKLVTCMDTTKICDNVVCQNCNAETRLLDFTLVDITTYDLGETIGGDIDKHGWAVKRVQSLKENPSLARLENYCGVTNTKDEPLGLGKGGPLKLGGSNNRRRLYDYTQVTPRKLKGHPLLADFRSFLQQTCNYTIDNTYQIEYPNVLFNIGPTTRQWYHRDYADTIVNEKNNNISYKE